MPDEPKPKPQPRLEGKVPWCTEKCPLWDTCPDAKAPFTPCVHVVRQMAEKIKRLERQLAEAKELLSRTNCPECLANAKAEGRRAGLLELACGLSAAAPCARKVTRLGLLVAADNARRLAAQDQDEGEQPTITETLDRVREIAGPAFDSINAREELLGLDAASPEDGDQDEQIEREARNVVRQVVDAANKGHAVKCEYPARPCQCERAGWYVAAKAGIDFLGAVCDIEDEQGGKKEQGE